MIDLGEIYRNELIPEQDYYVMLVEVRKENRGKSRPLIQVRLRIAEAQAPYSGTDLAVNIHPTPEADCIFGAFCESFAVGKDGQHNRRFARVRVRHTRYGQTDYSKVIFKPQKPKDLAYAAAFEKHQQKLEAADADEKQKKAETAAKKQAEKEAYEAKHGKRGRGRPRHGDGTGDEALFD